MKADTTLALLITATVAAAAILAQQELWIGAIGGAAIMLIATNLAPVAKRQTMTLATWGAAVAAIIVTASTWRGLPF